MRKKRKMRRILIAFFVIIGIVYAIQIIERRALHLVEKTESSSAELVTLAENQSSETLEKLVQIGSKEAQLYKEPSSESEKIMEINRGEWLSFVSVSEGWYQVITKEGLQGYIAQGDATLVEQEEKAVPSSLKEATIVLDPGHGGTDVGALSTGEDIYEKEVTLATAKAIQTALEAEGSTVILTRETDTSEALAEVVELSNETQADVFISLHYDSSEHSNEATGTTTYYYYAAYTQLAETINNQLATMLPLENRGVDYGNFQVLRENRQPSLLLELGYMNTDSDVAVFNTPNYREKVAQAIVDGLTEYFQVSTL